MKVTWTVYRTYRLLVSTRRDGTAPIPHEYGEVAGFDTRPEAAEFATRSRQTDAWAPHGAYDLDVSDPIRQTAPGAR